MIIIDENLYVYNYIMANFFKKKDKVRAIKYHRDFTGMGLKESKEIVDAIFAGTYLPIVTKKTMTNPSSTANSLDD